MDLLVNGGTPLHGEVVLRGAKNLVPKAMVASLLTDEPLIIEDVPRIWDTRIVSNMLRAHGVGVALEGNTLTLRAQSIYAPLDLDMSSSRIPLLMAAPLLHRLGHAQVPLPGGCQIGSRPIDYHLYALSRMGATLTEKEGLLHLSGSLHAADITLPYPSVGATEQVIFAAVLAQGTTTLRNAALEPEILDLLSLLQAMGSPLSLSPDRTLVIPGVSALHGAHHWPLPDRLEAASWACAAALTKGEILVHSARPEDMTSFLGAYQAIGGRFEPTPTGMLFLAPESLHAHDLQTEVYPGLSTDWQPPLTILLTQAEGYSTLHETVYEDRLGYTKALLTMGANITLEHECPSGARCRLNHAATPHVARILGATPLHPAHLQVPDLRAGFSYILAALATPGTSCVSGVDVVYRGYESFPEKLAALGASAHIR